LNFHNIGLTEKHFYDKGLKLLPSRSESYRRNHPMMRSPLSGNNYPIMGTQAVPWSRRNHLMGTELLPSSEDRIMTSAEPFAEPKLRNDQPDHWPDQDFLLCQLYKPQPSTLFPSPEKFQSSCQSLEDRSGITEHLYLSFPM
jgi:hypothetical protein